MKRIFSVSYLLGATALSWRNPVSVTGAELNMWTRCSLFLRGLAGDLRLSRPLRSVARGGRVVCWLFIPAAYR